MQKFRFVVALAITLLSVAALAEATVPPLVVVADLSSVACDAGRVGETRRATILSRARAEVRAARAAGRDAQMVVDYGDGVLSPPRTAAIIWRRC